MTIIEWAKIWWPMSTICTIICVICTRWVGGRQLFIDVTFFHFLLSSHLGLLTWMTVEVTVVGQRRGQQGIVNTNDTCQDLYITIYPLVWALSPSVTPKRLVDHREKNLMTNVFEQTAISVSSPAYWVIGGGGGVLQYQMNIPLLCNHYTGDVVNTKNWVVFLCQWCQHKCGVVSGSGEDIKWLQIWFSLCILLFEQPLCHFKFYI